MLDSIECPYCGAEYIDPDIAEDGEGVYTVECEGCGRKFDVRARLEFRLDEIVSEELKDCFKRCFAWDFMGHCAYGEPFKLCGGRVTCTVPDCPLGHPMEIDQRCAKGEPKRRFRASRQPRTKREINRRFRHGLEPPVPDKK